MRNSRTIIFLGVLCSALSVTADSVLLKSGIEKNRIIELYTSEGCSSCPSADKWISGLKNSDDLWNDVIPIAFHVDYWDQLGWVDELAEKNYSDRQREYRREGSISQVYTPGFVVDGKEWRGFFKRKMLKPAAPVDVGEITLQIQPDSIIATFDPQIVVSDDLVFHTAVLGFDIEKEIQAGENAGKTLHHDFAVIAYDKKKVTHDNNTFATDMLIPQAKHNAVRKAIVVWISDLNSQAPLQAIGDWL